MATNYPGGLDSFTNPVAANKLYSPSHSQQHTDLNDAVEAIQIELGRNPSGSYATVRDRLDYFTQQTVSPEQYGAAADGSTDDTVAIRTALATGLNLALTPGKTYIFSGDLVLSDKQILFGNGATLKKAPQVSSTTATPLNGATTTFTLADATGFVVGMNIVFADSTVSTIDLVAADTLSTNDVRITAVDGNNITVGTAPNITNAGTSNVYSASFGVRYGADSTIRDLKVDGNRANFSWARWEVNAEISHASNDSHRATVENCHVVEGASEGINLRGNGTRVSGCKIEGVNGNGIHLSTTDGPIVEACYVKGTNEGSTALGHVTGALCWSSTITNARIAFNHLEDAYTGCGDIGSNDGQHTIIGNTFVGPFAYAGLEIQQNTGTRIIGNQFYDCGGTYEGMIVQTAGGEGTVISGNYFENSDVNILGAAYTEFSHNRLNTCRVLSTSTDNLQIENNKFEGCTDDACIKFTNGQERITIAGNVMDLVGNTSTYGIWLDGPCGEGLCVENNKIYGGSTAIFSLQNHDQALVQNNHLEGFADYGIYWGKSSGTEPYTIKGNVIATTASTTSGGGIRTNQPNALVVGNVVDNHEGTAALQWGIRIGYQANVLKNDILGDMNVAGLQVDAGSTGTYLVYNCVDDNVVDSGTSTTNTGTIAI